MLDFHDDDPGVSGRLHALLDRWDDLRASPPPGVRVAGAVLVVAVVGVVGWRSLRTVPEVDVAERLPIVGLDVTTTSASRRPVVVHVVGAVASPGVLELAEGDRIADALHAAGGPLADADVAGLNLAAPLVDGSQIVVGVRGDDDPGPSPSGTVGPAVGGEDAGAPVDLNRATAAQLESLPGVGPATSAKILEHRDRVGAFRSVDELLSVPGIGPAKLDALRDLVVVP